MTAEPIALAPSLDTPIQVGLLGPLEMAGGLAPSARKVRQTLALLAVRANTLVSVEDFVLELWDARPPRKEMQSVQSYILELRRLKVLDIEFRHCGYLLHLPSALDVDSARFVHFVESARRDLRSGALLMAQDLLRAAFSLWRGNPLEDVHKGPLLSGEAARLIDWWHTARDLQWEIDLRSGRHRELVDDLAASVRGNPMREDTAAKLMLALYRSNRRAEALQVFQRLRAELVREIGLEPCPALCRLQQQILAGDPVLELNGEH